MIIIECNELTKWGNQGRKRVVMMFRFSLISFCAVFSLSHFGFGHGSAGEHAHHSDGMAFADSLTFGQNGLRYKVDLGWAKADPVVAPVINSHNLAEGRDGLIHVITDHPKNAFSYSKNTVRLFVRLAKGSWEDVGLRFSRKTARSI